MKEWELDKVTDLINGKYKDMDSPNNVDGWMRHSQNLTLCAESRTFAEKKYSRDSDTTVYDRKFEDRDNIQAISEKVNKKKSTMWSNQTKERVLCCEIFDIAKVWK